MKIRSLFSKYQKQILSFANTRLGKSYLGINTNDKILKITPDAWYVGLGNGAYQANFHPQSPFMRRLTLPLTSMALIEEEMAFRFSQLKEGCEFVIPQYLGLTTPRWFLPQIHLLDFSPDANPETTTVDGAITNANLNETYSTKRDAADGTSAFPSGVDDTGSGEVVAIFAHGTNANRWNRLNRSFYLFDTSSLDDNANISSAILKVWFVSKADDFTSSLSVVTTTPASNTDIATADYDQFGTTKQAADTALSAISTGAYTSISLNGTGIGNISKTGITKFGLRLTSDTDNSEPTWGASQQAYLTGNFADDASNIPTLTVNFAVASTGYGFFM